VINKLRNHRLIAIALLFLILSAATAPLCQTPSTEEYEVVKIDTNLVTLNVSVTNKNRPVTGLATEDFQIQENGARVKPEYFDSQGPASIIFVLDISTSMRGEKWRNLREGLKDFLKKQETSDYTFIIFNEKARLVRQSITAKEFWKVFETIKPDGETALYDGLALAFDQVNCLSRRNKAIVLLSDGEDNRSTTTLATIQQEVATTHTTIYAVGIVIDSSAPIEERYRGRDLLKELASSTGGLSFFPTPIKLESTLQEITTEITNQYSFGYYPSNKKPGWRSIEVSLLKTNLRHNTKVRYQSRYMYK
jgi:VWFA-related protein